MGLQSYSLRAFGIDGKEGALQKIADLGLHWVEFFGRHYPITPDKKKIGEMNSKLAKHDMSVSAHGVNGFGKNHEANEKIFQFAKLAGIPNISANPAADSFESLDKLVAKHNVRRWPELSRQRLIYCYWMNQPIIWIYQPLSGLKANLWDHRSL